MTLGCKYEIVGKSGVPKEALDAGYDFSMIKFQVFATNGESATLERRASRECLINDLIELIGVSI